MEEEMLIDFTVQGDRITPVPAAVSGVRAGHGASRSSDCEASEVGYLASVAANATRVNKGSAEKNPTRRARITGTGTPITSGGRAAVVNFLATAADNATGGGEELNPFRKSSKILRTPPRITAKSQKAGATQEVATPPPVSSCPNSNPHPSPIPSQSPPQSCPTRRKLTSAKKEGMKSTEKQSGEGTSSKGEHINQLQGEEEVQLEKCRQIVAKMRAATCRQRNISNELAELEEAFSVIKDCREKWKKAEEEEKKALSETKTPTLAEKRPASSPAGLNEEKRKREDDRYAERVVISKRAKRQMKAAKRAEAAEQATTPKAVDAGAQVKPAARRLDKKKIKPRSEAILIRPGDGRTYADVLREIKEKINPEESGTKVKTIRQTRTGGIRLEIGDSKDKGGFQDSIRGILGERAAVSCLEPKCVLEIKHLDCITDEAEVKTALQREDQL